jgi:hypothetical protein
MNNIDKKIIEISNDNNIKIFKKNRDKWVFRDKRRIIRDCNKIKQQKIKDLSTNLKHLSSREKINRKEVENLNTDTINAISSIDTLIDMLNSDNNDYIEVYGN